MDAKVKIFGHPVHPMLVAFPVAFNTGTFASYIIYGVTGNELWLRFAITLNVAAVAMALVAALPGFIDWWLGIPAHTAAKRTGVIHMMLNYASVALFGITLAMYAADWNATDVSPMLAIVLTGAGIGLTILAGFQGWKLVQDHHVGVNLTREQAVEDELRERPVRRAG